MEEKKLYNVEADISFTVSKDIIASSEKEAIALMKEEWEDYYRLKVHGADHDPKKVSMDIEAYEYLDD